jgi:WD40 repeat protein
MDGSPETNPFSPPESTPGDDSSSASPNPPSTRARPRGEKVWSTAVSPDGRFVVQATTARRVLLTDLSINSQTDLSEHRITAVAFAPDGTWFAAADQDGRVTLWDSARGETLRTVLTHSDVLRSVAISPQGDKLAAGGRDGAVLVSDLGIGSVVNFPSNSSAVNCVRFSSDGRQLAVAVGDWMSNNPGEVLLLDSATGQMIATLDCATSPGALAFASNDELIVGLWNGQTQLWNLVHRHVVGSALAHKNVVAAAAFSPDNPVLREVTFVAEELTNLEDNSPLAVLRNLFTVPANE